MLFVDYRAGSHELVEPLQAAGLPVEETTLEAGDVAFEGRGAGGAPLLIGIEYKKLGELVTSLRDERLQGHQLPAMKQAGYDHTYLFIEGELLYDRQGRLQRKSRFKELVPLPGGMGVGELLKRLFVMDLCAGLRPWWTVNQRQTVSAIAILYRTWTDVDLDRHKSHLGVYQPPTFIPVSEFRGVVMRLPGIGHKASLAVEEHFGGSLFKAFTARAEEWAEIVTIGDNGKARRIGTKVATSIVSFIHNQEG